MSGVAYRILHDDSFILILMLADRYPSIVLGKFATRFHVASLTSDLTLAVGRLPLRLQLPSMCRTTGRPAVFGYWISIVMCRFLTMYNPKGRRNCNFGTNPGPNSCLDGGCNGGLECDKKIGTVRNPCYLLALLGIWRTHIP
jgi:hypothetical protein